MLSIYFNPKIYLIQQISAFFGKIFLVIALRIDFVVGLVCNKAVVSVKLHQVWSVVAQELAFGLVGAAVSNSEALDVDLVLKSPSCIPIVKSRHYEKVYFSKRVGT